MKLIELAQNEIAKRDLATKITKLEKDKSELQTKYDMEVRTKEELVKQLELLRVYVKRIEIFGVDYSTTLDYERLKLISKAGFNFKQISLYLAKDEEYDFSFIKDLFGKPNEYFIVCPRVEFKSKIKLPSSLNKLRYLGNSPDFIGGSFLFHGYNSKQNLNKAHKRIE